MRSRDHQSGEGATVLTAAAVRTLPGSLTRLGPPKATGCGLPQCRPARPRRAQASRQRERLHPERAGRCRRAANRGESPGAEHEARLPVRHKLHCEAPTGVADPITTWPSEVWCLYPGGWVVLVSRKPSTQQSSVNCDGLVFRFRGRRYSQSSCRCQVPFSPSLQNAVQVLPSRRGGRIPGCSASGKSSFPGNRRTVSM